MKIDLFSIGKFTIHGYGLMIAIGILCCVAMASYRAKKNGLDQEAIVDIGIYGVIGGFLGAKIILISLWQVFQWHRDLEESDVFLQDAAMEGRQPPDLVWYSRKVGLLRQV